MEVPILLLLVGAGVAGWWVASTLIRDAGRSQPTPVIPTDLTVNQEEVWNEVCDQLDLRRIDDYPKNQLHAEGKLEGEKVVFYREAGTTQYGGTVFEVDIEDLLPEDFGLELESAADALETTAGTEDIVVGDEQLDETYRITGRESREVKAFVWTEGVADHLWEIGRFEGHSVIRDGSLTMGLPGGTPAPERCVRNLKAIAKWARDLRHLVERPPESSEGEGWVAPG